MTNDLLLTPITNRNDLFYPDLKINISKVMPTLLQNFDISSPKKNTLLSQIQHFDSWKKITESNIENIIFIVLDALGLEQFRKYSTWLNKKFKTNGIAISSVFPTITSTCITTLHLGTMPINHGIVGQKIHFQEIDNIVDTLTLRSKTGYTSLTTAGVNVKGWMWSPYILNQNDSFRYIKLIENNVTKSGLSLLLNEENNSIGYYTQVDCFTAAKKIIEKNSTEKLFLGIYSSAIDNITHRYTTESQALADEIKNLEELIKTLLERLDPNIRKKTAIFLTADHGQENLKADKRINITSDEEEELLSMIIGRGRSGRVVHIYSKEDKQEETVNWLHEKIGEQGIIFTPKDYPKLMGKGANSKIVINRIGNIQIILGKGSSLFFGHTGIYDPEFNLGLNATHGSLSHDELLVPFIFGLANDLI